ncbi:WEB family At3g02930, chloroplastic-like [Olea europaea subsp. europaea]|uniref:WEB family At3g02930, chloroplastic-like n=1 Tax=Olea europaea subsp. europaea TaxID=158383 RepID=A0A8S0RVE7_OLEEU|nr:WEB family At3g02930, chloroplastic-like [Olea europaea subsp. europaea]CAA3027483.1 WEB family At3g02930, chloroplastic-like [Olea europaea subsp. europaea]
MSTKSKSAASETHNKTASPATPGVSKSSRGVAKSDADSASPLQNSRLSVDRSPKLITPKPVVDRRSPKLSTTPDRKPSRTSKPSELQEELNLAREDLKKAKEKLVLVEKEKAKALDELIEAQRSAEEADGNFREALAAQKRAEENIEIEKFRAVEMEQAGIEAIQKKDEEWQREIEAVRTQHALDVAALLSANQELDKLKQELAMFADAKNQALSHAEDASKIAEINAENVEILSAELVRLNSMLDLRVETEANENSKLVEVLKLEIDSLRQELERTNINEEKLAEKEATLEQLNIDLEAAKMAESYACNLVEEWQKRALELEVQAEEAKKLERSASESLESVMKQLEGSNDSLRDAESEITSLKEKVGLLEISIRRQKGDLEESERKLELAKEEASKMVKKVEYLVSELETVKEERIQASNNEKLAADSVQNLLEEKHKLINDLENSRDEEEKSKKAMESLASALHEVSSEAREAKEKLLSVQIENENYGTQIEDLRLVLKATNEKYESMLDDAKQEIEALANSLDQSKHDLQNSKTEWEQQELRLMESVKQSEEEISSMEKEIRRLVNLLHVANEEAFATKKEEDHLKISLKEAESEVIYLKEVLGEAKAESMRLKESLMDKENELQNILQENEELQIREAASLKKIEELSKLLEDLPKRVNENGELTESEKDYDMLPKVVEFSEQSGLVEFSKKNGTEDVKPKMELQPQQREQPVEEKLAEVNDVLNHESSQIATEVENMNGNSKDNENKVKEDDDSTNVDLKMWESCKIEEKDLSPQGGLEQESFEEEVDSKTDGGESYDQVNGLPSKENLNNAGSSPSKQQSQKKKKPLLHKFGNLLKKKGTTNQK